MSNKATLTLLFIASFLFTFAQSNQLEGFYLPNNKVTGCAKNHMHDLKMATDAAYRYQSERAEEQIYQRLLRQQKSSFKEKNNEQCSDEGVNGSGVITIPVVIHILYPSDTPESGNSNVNPDDAQINRAMVHLNDAFRNRNAYKDSGRGSKDGDNPDRELLKSADIQIEFCLAKRDIFGKPTNGIMRYESNTYSDLNSNRDGEMKNWVAARNNNAFPTTDYVNVYLVNIICDGNTENQSNCNTAGYAYLAGAHGRSFDGIVNMSRYFGTSTDLSKIHIHEFGHYLNLSHTFDGECGGSDCLRSGDRVCDTPPDNSTTRISCGRRQNTCNTDTESGFFSVDQEDMYENYMDYASVQCQNTFTQGQKDRMRAALFGIRASLLESDGCVPVGSSAAAITAISSPEGIACDDQITPRIEVENKGEGQIRSLRIQYELNEGAPRFFNWNGSIASGATAIISLPQINLSTAGQYNFFAQILQANGQDIDATIDGICQSFQYAPPISQLPFCQSIPTREIPVEFAINNEDEGIGFRAVELDACDTKEYVLALETWSQFPDRTTKDEIFTQAIDLNDYDAAFFEFEVAYAATFPNFNTILDISVSDNCGLTYQSVYQKTGDRLATTEVEARNSRDDAAFFVPNDCNEWRKEVIDLTAFAGRKINIRIQASTANVTNSGNYEWGNNLYLDNFCMNFERCSAPITQAEREVSICRDLELVAEVNISEDKAVFWWVTSNNPITNIINNQQIFESALGFTPKGDDSGLSGQGNIIFRSNAGQGQLKIPVDCSRMNGKNYYAIPFIINSDFSDPFFNDCTFGQPVLFTCDCTNACALNIRDIQIRNANNCGVSNGSLTVLTNDAENTEYSINGVNWQRSNQFFGLAAGTYTIQIRNRDDRNCTATRTIEVNEPDAPSIKSIVISSPSSCNATNGSIDIISDGAETIEFRLNGGTWQSTSIFNNLAAGEYIVEVRSRPGSTCITSRTITVSEAASASIASINASTTTWCGSEDGSLVINLQNAENQAIEYSLDGEIWQTSNVFENLAAGSYEVKIRLQNEINCGNDSRTVSIQEGTNDSVERIEANNPSGCDLDDGRIAIMLQESDDRTMEFSIDDGETWQNSNIFENLAAATYFVQIRNANEFDCLSERSITLEAPSVEDITIQNIETIVPNACGASNGSIVIQSDASDAEYSIDGGETWQTSNEFSNLSGGTYFPQVRSGLCSFAEGESIELIPLAKGIQGSIKALNNPACINQNNDFSISITGGVAPYTVHYRVGQEIFTLENYNSEEVFTFMPVSLLSIIRILSIEDAQGCRVESERSLYVYASRCGNRNNYDLATEFKLYPNQPNPFNENTMIRFDLPQAERVVLSVYEVTGKLVMQVEKEFEAGYQEWTLNTNDLPSTGVLYYTIETGKDRKTGKMVRIE
ncbi:MAG: M43 family zinc metalloprotease [Bacteroidota bacterium]